MEGLCILLRRLSYPCRYSDIISRFGLPVPVLNMVSNDVLDFIYSSHRHRITQWKHNVLNPAALQIYSNAIADKGAALHNCFGFVDGAFRPVCRPGEHQRVIYNGHTRVHALKFRCVALPNGLIGNLYGPVGKFCWVDDVNFTMFLTRKIGKVWGVKSERLICDKPVQEAFLVYYVFLFPFTVSEGRKHDASILADSGLLNDLQHFANSSPGNPFGLSSSQEVQHLGCINWWKEPSGECSSHTTKLGVNYLSEEGEGERERKNVPPALSGTFFHIFWPSTFDGQPLNSNHITWLQETSFCCQSDEMGI